MKASEQRVDLAAVLQQTLCNSPWELRTRAHANPTHGTCAAEPEVGGALRGTKRARRVQNAPVVAVANAQTQNKPIAATRCTLPPPRLLMR